MKTAIRSTVRMALSAVALAVLAGCSSFAPTSGREQARPQLDRDWPTLAATAVDAGHAAAQPIEWQSFVRDPQLAQRIEDALAHNRDLRVAALNVERAQAALALQNAQRQPMVGVGVGAQRAPNAMGNQTNMFTAGVQLASWEIDLFGRLASLDEAARAQYLASEAGQRAARLALVSQVIAADLALRADTTLLQLARSTLAGREEALRLVTMREKAGYSPLTELDAQRQLVAQARGAVAQYRRQQAQDRHALALLIGHGDFVDPTLTGDAQPTAAQWASGEVRAPGAAGVSGVSTAGATGGASTSAAPGAAGVPGNAVAGATVPLGPLSTELLADVPVGLPSTVLLERPDVIQAERTLEAASANVEAARKAFWPTITLTGSAGQASPQLSGLFQGGNFVYTLAANLALAIFDGGRRQAGVDAARAGERIAVAQYERAVQSAFRETADALAGVQTWREQLAAQQAQVDAARDMKRLVDLKFQQGAASLLEQLDAERTLFAAEQALVGVRQAELANRVALFKAVGR